MRRPLRVAFEVPSPPASPASSPASASGRESPASSASSRSSSGSSRGSPPPASPSADAPAALPRIPAPPPKFKPPPPPRRVVEVSRVAAAAPAAPAPATAGGAVAGRWEAIQREHEAHARRALDAVRDGVVRDMATMELEDREVVRGKIRFFSQLFASAVSAGASEARLLTEVDAPSARRTRDTLRHRRRCAADEDLRARRAPRPTFETGQQKGAKFPTSKAHISAVSTRFG